MDLIQKLISKNLFWGLAVIIPILYVTIILFIKLQEHLKFLPLITEILIVNTN